jgi:hypothetical protein
MHNCVVVNRVRDLAFSSHSLVHHHHLVKLLPAARVKVFPVTYRLSSGILSWHPGVPGRTTLPSDIYIRK